MARSQQSFNKRENEKKRIKKQQDKLQKKEERKANVQKGKSLDDMIAYVDEFGNITDTPPDPKNKEEINLEDIQIGVAKQDDSELPVKPVRTGVLSTFTKSKGYGFIRDIDTNESIFVHISGMEEELEEGDKVTFETERNFKGLNAKNVKLFRVTPPTEPES
ncbi:MAG: cold shock domain-containing protein [Bacteroidales bacterium]